LNSYFKVLFILRVKKFFEGKFFLIFVGGAGVDGGLQAVNQLGGRTLQRRAQRRCSASGQSSV